MWAPPPRLRPHHNSLMACNIISNNGNARKVGQFAKFAHASWGTWQV